MRSMLLLFVFVPVVVLAQQPDFPRQLDLFVAGQQVISIPNLEKVALGDTAIADVIMFGNGEVLLTGSSPGQTTLRVWQKGAAAWIDVKVVVAQSLLVKPVALAEIALKVGEVKALDCPGIGRLAVGDPDIADVQVDGTHSLNLKGVTEGATSLIWWDVATRHELLLRVSK